ncbi:hypothetical protein F383_30249 [Gossypium arboreum]|uniref:Uncharacterized protein n=1 Tax=Gossypium arboreum TaxID=29729 RepID=A0A0B0MVT8_GOSAR|nr:hypothetical protein F383_30249 [Gossypium arboreum]
MLLSECPIQFRMVHWAMIGCDQMCNLLEIR